MKPLMTDELKSALNAVMKTELRPGILRGVEIDSRCNLSDKIFFAIKGKNHDGHSYVSQAVANGVRNVVIDHDIEIGQEMRDSNVNIYKVDDTVSALGRLAKYYRSEMISSVHIIAVTGSNGKTTTREMIHHVLAKKLNGCQSKKNFNNAIGCPLSILNIESKYDFAAIELGTSMPGEIHYLSSIVQPDIAVITSIGPSHLEGLNNLDGVCAEKASIVSGLKPGGTVICNGVCSDAIVRLEQDCRKVITFGFGDQYNISASDYKPDGIGGLSFVTNDRCSIRLPIPGRHNVTNALAALAVCRRLDISTEEFAKAISDFNAVGGRLNILLINGVTVIDDSYNANPASMTAALAVLDDQPGKRKIFCCGDMGELGELSVELHKKLGEEVALSSADFLITAGEFSKHTAKAAVEYGLSERNVISTDTSEEAADKLAEILQQGDVVLAKGSRSAKMEKIVDKIKTFGN